MLPSSKYSTLSLGLTVIVLDNADTLLDIFCESVGFGISCFTVSRPELFEGEKSLNFVIKPRWPAITVDI